MMKSFPHRQTPVGPDLPREWSHGQEDELDDYREARARIEAVWKQHERQRELQLSWLKVIKFVLGIVGLAVLGYTFTALWMAL